MDTDPADLDRKAFLLRQRVPEMELGADRIRLKPQSSLERIHDALEQTGLQTYLVEHTKPFTLNHNKISSGMLSPALAKAANRGRNEASRSTLSNARVSPKSSFLPALHKKTHFQAATALMMQYPKNATCLASEQTTQPETSQKRIAMLNSDSKTTLNAEIKSKPFEKTYVDEFEEFGLDRESESASKAAMQRTAAILPITTTPDRTIDEPTIGSEMAS
jgi:hypothetical protein